MDDFNNTRVVITNDIDPNLAGAFVWWRLSGDMNIMSLEATWAENHLKEPMPSKPSFQVALRRAVNEQANRRRLIRPLPKDQSGYAIVDESPDHEKTLNYDIACKVYFERSGKVAISGGSDVMRSEILAAYERHLSTVSASDVREWLTGVIIPTVLALKLRDGGGVYFIPQPTLAKFRAIVRCVKWSSDHAIFAVPAMKTEDAVEGIIDALRHESETTLQKLKEDLDKGELGVRALKSRLDACAQQEKKLTQYELMLGRKQMGISNDLHMMRSSLMEAMLTQGEEG